MHRHPGSRRLHALSAALGLLLPFVVGCGSDGGNPVAPLPPAPPSPTTGTLVVVASVAATADSAGSFDTEFSVTVSDTGSGAPVSGATVEFSTPSGVVGLNEDSGTAGLYRTQSAGHAAGTYGLSVTRGLVIAAGSIEMPEAHVVTSPACNDTLSSSNQLDVTWTRAVAAQEAWLDTKDWTTGVQSDDGSAKVPKGHNDPRNDQSVGVTRRNSANPPSMAVGSRLQASVRVAVEPFVVQ